MITMKHTQAQLKKPNTAIPLSVQRMDVKNDRATVLLHVGAALDSEDKLEAAVLSAFDGKARLMTGSAHRPTQDPNLVLACVTLNRDIRPYDAVGAEGFTAVTANVFRDADDMIWKRCGEGETAVLVKDSDDDLEAVLAKRQTRSIVTASARVSLHETAAIGEAIVWYDSVSEKMRTGILCASDCGFDLNTQTVHELSAEDIFASAPSAYQREVANARTALFDNGAPPLTKTNYLSKMLAYWALQYKSNETYYMRLKALVERQFGAAAIRQTT